MNEAHNVSLVVQMRQCGQARANDTLPLGSWQFAAQEDERGAVFAQQSFVPGRNVSNWGLDDDHGGGGADMMFG